MGENGENAKKGNKKWNKELKRPTKKKKHATNIKKKYTSPHHYPFTIKNSKKKKAEIVRKKGSPKKRGCAGHGVTQGDKNQREAARNPWGEDHEPAHPHKGRKATR